MSKLIAIALALAFAGCKADTAAANKSAQEYMKNVPGATGYECTASDSDRDGYCSCTIFRKDQDPLPVTCGCERFCVWNCADGCKYVPFAGGARPR